MPPPPMTVLAETLDEPSAPAFPEPAHRPLSADDPVVISQRGQGGDELGGQPSARARGHGLYGVSIKAHGRHRKSRNTEPLAG